MGSISVDEYLHTPKPAPEFRIPAGASIKVSIINTTGAMEVPLGSFMSPVMPGHEILRGPAFSFLIEHTTGRKLLFDLGCRKDWRNLPPKVLDLVTQPHWKIEVEKSVVDILQENGVDAKGGAIEAIIWSHWHYDHIGDPSTFPGSTNLIVGPGTTEAFCPAYPTNPDSVLLESDFAGRETITIDFEKDPLKIGNYRGYDFFGDGSFYLLDAPGHAIGHISGLARVTSTSEGDGEDTFILMGGDTAHHGGEFRPTEYLPLPKSITPSPRKKAYPAVCPGHIFEAIHPAKKGTAPFYEINDGIPFDKKQAHHSCGLMQEFDALDSVFVIIAHDASLLEPEVGMTWFPHGSLRDWKKRDLAKRARWGFLKDYNNAVDVYGVE
ncbi:beta-lactamase-like protein [Xylogone sp. PMI_703]|nr:beta-lactamase-like protein [Xylogone sp. PMI_703]